jgi:hypothetical protein
MPSNLAKTHYLEEAILNEVLRGTNFVPPTTVYVALFTSPTDKDGGGTEVSGGGYARQPVTFGPPGPGTNGRKAVNSAEVLFPEATEYWGIVTHVALFDAATGGNMLYQGALAPGAEREVKVGDQLRFKAGELSVEEA